MARLVLLLAISGLFSGCSVMTKVGGALEEYGNENDGFVSSVAGVGGRVYSSVGCSGTGSDNPECEEIAAQRKAHKEERVHKEDQQGKELSED